MSCHDARALLSAWVDEALGVEERARLEAHLDGCADCRREAERFRQAVALLQRVERPRAPVGFVDRVLQAARPAPWYGRLLRGAFLPVTLKLPIEAAAVVLVAIAAVYIFQRTPELQQAARQEAPQATGRVEAPAAPPAEAPRPRAAEPERALGKEGDRDTRDVQMAAPGGPAEKKPVAPPPASQAPGAATDARKEAAAESPAVPRARDQSREAPSRQPAAPPALPREGRRADSLEERAKSATAPAQPGLAAKARLPAASVVGALAVKDREPALGALTDLLARLGGVEVSRRLEPGATVVDVLVPQAAYADFTLGLARIGSWRPEGEPAELPAQVRITLRLSE